MRVQGYQDVTGRVCIRSLVRSSLGDEQEWPGQRLPGDDLGRQSPAGQAAGEWLTRGLRGSQAGQRQWGGLGTS